MLFFSRTIDHQNHREDVHYYYDTVDITSVRPNSTEWLRLPGFYPVRGGGGGGGLKSAFSYEMGLLHLSVHSLQNLCVPSGPLPYIFKATLVTLNSSRTGNIPSCDRSCWGPRRPTLTHGLLQILAEDKMQA